MRVCWRWAMGDLLGDQYAEELPARPAMRLCALEQLPPAAAGVGQVEPAQQRIELHGGRIVGLTNARWPRSSPALLRGCGCVLDRPGGCWLHADQVGDGEKSFIAALCGVFSDDCSSIRCHNHGLLAPVELVAGGLRSPFRHPPDDVFGGAGVRGHGGLERRDTRCARHGAPTS